jgi:hypothetical protein
MGTCLMVVGLNPVIWKGHGSLQPKVCFLMPYLISTTRTLIN